MKKKLKKLLENKTVLIAPYNDISIDLYNTIEKSKINGCILLGYIDNKKIGNHIYSFDNDVCSADIILITSSNYKLKIYDDLKDYSTNKDSIFFVAKYFNKFKYDSIDKNRKKIVCFGNCQGNHIGILLEIFVGTKYEIVKYFNYKDEDKNTILNSIKESFLTIYQPLPEKYEDLSAPNIEKIAKENNTLTITFAYIYNSGLYSLEYGKTNKIQATDIIETLLTQGVTKESIVSDYIEGKIDFKLKERFSNSLKIMQVKETTTDIKLTDFIKKNYQRKKLFFGYNHPTNLVFFELLKQIENKVPLGIRIRKRKKLPRLTRTLSPISPYDKAMHNFKFDCDYSMEWSYQGVAIIELIVNNFIIKNLIKDNHGKTLEYSNKTP